MVEEKRHVIPMNDKQQRWNFGLIEILAGASLGLVGWNLLMTVDLKKNVAVNAVSIEKATVKAESAVKTINVRIGYLEIEKNKGGRFTAAEAEAKFDLIDSDIRHIQNMFDRHANRTEPKIDEIHNAIMNDIIKRQ